MSQRSAERAVGRRPANAGWSKTALAQAGGWTALAAAMLWGWLGTTAGSAGAFVRDGVPYAIDQWETDDDLPQNSVLALAQTRDGYLWLGTGLGLVRFDGLSFTVFDRSNTPGLPSDAISGLFEDSRGRLWIATLDAGAALAQAGRLVPLEIGRGGRHRRVVAMTEDATGAVWLLAADGELARHWEARVDVWTLGRFSLGDYRGLITDDQGLLLLGEDSRITVVDPRQVSAPTDLPVQASFAVARLEWLLASRRGGYWRLANGRVQRCSGQQVLQDLGPYPWSGMKVAAACEDAEGNLLVGTLGAGVFWFDARGGVTRLSKAEGLSYDHIVSLAFDREGNLWVGTDGGGLNRVKPQVFQLLEPTAGAVVQSVCEDAVGGLWIGFNAIGEDAFGVAKWDEGMTAETPSASRDWSLTLAGKPTGVFQRFGPAQGLVNSSVWSVCVDGQQHVWAGTVGGLFLHRDGRFERPRGGAWPGEVLAMHRDRQGQLWAGTRRGLLRWDGVRWREVGSREGPVTEEVRALADDREGNLWVGTRGGGLRRLRDDQVAAWRQADGGLPSDDITSLHADAEGVLWVGTHGGGLGRLAQGRWTRYTTAEGLVSNYLGYLLEDRQGYLWIGSNAGLMRVRKALLNDLAEGQAAALTVRAYGRADGLPTRECTAGSQPAACQSRDGRLWFATIKGLISVDPARLRLNTNPPPVVIEAVFLDGQAYGARTLRAPLPPLITVPARRERLEIRYTSLNLAAPELARFRYRMDGLERDWTEAGNGRVARYSKLPPGDYRFEVTACNEDGVWNPLGQSVAIAVLPPFWRTWWFLSLATALVLGLVAAAVSFISTQKLHRQLDRLRQQEALEQERARIARDLHDQLGANLTQVALLGELVEADKDQPQEVADHARQIAATARETTRALDEIVWAANPANDTLDSLVSYICKCAQDTAALAGLRYRFDVPRHLPAAALPPDVRHNVFLAAKEAINNVVKHARASEIRLRLRLESGRFTLEIEDDGCGLAGRDESAALTRNGLRNMRRRMDEVGGQFTLGPAPGGGTRVGLSVPLEKNSNALK